MFKEHADKGRADAVGWACQNYHKLYRRPRGFYVCAEDRGAMVNDTQLRSICERSDALACALLWFCPVSDYANGPAHAMSACCASAVLVFTL